MSDINISAKNICIPYKIYKTDKKGNIIKNSKGNPIITGGMQNMVSRFNKYLKKHGVEPKKIYKLNTGSGEYVTNKVYKDMKKRTKDYKKIKGILPKCTYVKSIGNAPKPVKLSDWIYEYRYIKDYNIRQENGYYCANNMVQAIWYNLTGILIDEYTLAKWAWTTPNGTGHEGIENALETLAGIYKKSIQFEWKYFSEVGWKKVSEILDDKKKTIGFHINYRYGEDKNPIGHYEYMIAVNLKEKKCILPNSLGVKVDGKYKGYFETRTFSQQERYINGMTWNKSCLIVELM